MASQSGSDIWSEIMESEEKPPKINVVYRRKAAQPKINQGEQVPRLDTENRVSIAGNKRISWRNRSLSIRGRISIAVPRDEVHKAEFKRKEAKKKPKQAFLKPPPNFIKDQVAYFQEVDSFELLEESPSPKNFSNWANGPKDNHLIVKLQSIIDQTYKKWLISKRLVDSSGSLTMALVTPLMPMGSICTAISEYPDENVTKIISPVKISSRFSSDLKDACSSSTDNDVAGRNSFVQRCSILNDFDALHITNEVSEDLGVAVGKLSLRSSSTPSDMDHLDAFTKLLTLCGQSVPSSLSEVFSKYCDLSCIIKVGEGTYGEAFKADGAVFKIVPIDEDFLVNGEVQKRSAELFEELLLSLTLNSLREYGANTDSQNKCPNFIETKDLRVCQGAYDASLIRAWEDWDDKHGSENDHPMAFPEKQCYVVFILADGGKDLESFVLSNFNEAQSLLVQVTAALAVAEAACEFEHRDLHWGNILLSRSDARTTEYTLQGRQMWANTFGLSVSIIDFTLSRINTGETILFLDLSADPGLFEGPKGEKQFETYRKMLEVTDGFWEGSFPKTNVLWLHYLVDILLSKKSFQRTTKEERDLRSFRKRLHSYNSAQDALSDAFFTDLWIDHAL